MQINEVSGEIVASAIEVHKALGPGLLESSYEACLVHELRTRGFEVETQKPLPLEYKGLKVDAGYRLDVLVDKRVVVEVKSVEALTPLHTAQVLTYLRLGGYKLGLLLNFNVPVMCKGIKRIVNGL